MDFFLLFLYSYFVTSQLAGVKYMTLCIYCLFFFRSRIAGFRPISALELVPLALQGQSTFWTSASLNTWIL